MTQISCVVFISLKGDGERHCSFTSTEWTAGLGLEREQQTTGKRCEYLRSKTFGLDFRLNTAERMVTKCGHGDPGSAARTRKVHLQ